MSTNRNIVHSTGRAWWVWTTWNRRRAREEGEWLSGSWDLVHQDIEILCHHWRVNTVHELRKCSVFPSAGSSWRARRKGRGRTTWNRWTCRRKRTTWRWRTQRKPCMTMTVKHTHTDINTQINYFRLNSTINEDLLCHFSFFHIFRWHINLCLLISELHFCHHHQGPVGFPGDPGPPGEVGPRVSKLSFKNRHQHLIYTP